MTGTQNTQRVYPSRQFGEIQIIIALICTQSNLLREVGTVHTYMYM